MLKRFSLGTGDRFGQEGQAQLKAIQKAQTKHDITITPVWNKSHREHQIIGTGPEDVRKEADRTVEEMNWQNAYLVDADHITKEIVDSYIPCSNFFTIDVADYIGNESKPEEKEVFVQRNSTDNGNLDIPGIEETFRVDKTFLNAWADQYLVAIQQAGKIYEYIRDKKSGDAVFEISMDEVDTPQTPIELYFILKTLAENGVQINTIAPKFTGNFYKGIDYIGDIDQFVKEFEQDLLVISYAIDRFYLPSDLKLSVHSGSDKFSLYPYIHELLDRYDAGVHLKTSGTTWLEELIGLALSGNDGLSMVKAIYEQAYGRYEELTQPYAPVVDIEKDQLPYPEAFCEWTGQIIAAKLEHNPDSLEFDPQIRQFLHCSYKIAAEQGEDFIRHLQQNKNLVADRVTYNLYERHIKPLFVG